MKQLLKEHNIYTLIWCLYHLQGILYAEGSIISRSLLMVFLLMSLFYFYKVLYLPNKPTIFTAINTIVIMFTIYGILRLIWGSDVSWLMQSDNTYFLKTHLSSILPIYAFYFFSIKNNINGDWFKFIFIAYIIVATYEFFYQQSVNMLLHNNAEEVTNGKGYAFVALFPLIALLKKPTLQYVILIYSMIFIIMGMKRGALIIGAVCFIIFLAANIKAQNKSHKIIAIIVSTLVLIITYKFLEHMMDSSEYFNHRIQQTQEGDASNRDDMYPVYFAYIINQTSIINFLFGNGAEGTIKYFGEYAHNDWLEIGINHGLIGIGLYLWYWICMFKTWWKARTICTNNITLAIGLFIIIYFMATLFSMSINDMPLFATSVFGYCLAKYQQSKENQQYAQD